MIIDQAYNYRAVSSTIATAGVLKPDQLAVYSRYAIESGRWTTEEADRFMQSIWQPGDYPGWTEWLDKVQRHFKR